MKFEIKDIRVFSLKNGILSYHLKFINGKNKEYSINLKFLDNDLISSSCTCAYGSFFKFSKKNMKEKKECYHLLEAYKFIKKINKW